MSLTLTSNAENVTGTTSLSPLVRYNRPVLDVAMMAIVPIKQ